MVAIIESGDRRVAPDKEPAYGRPLILVARELGKHLATMHRWRVTGITDPGGVRRRLHMTRVGGRWYVRSVDIEAFFVALSGADTQPPTPPVTNTSRAAERAARELAAIGI
jgi:hypothetical protein